jgi:NAD(P)-dependent dehydrogenase (short-subunit alcohol dehydrogenase family)
MQHVLVVGANRGLGLGFVEALLARGSHVVATVRKPLEAVSLERLAAEAPLEILQLDVADTDSRARFFRDMRSRELDTVIHNAGIYGPRGLLPGELPEEDWMEVLQVDTVAPLLVVQGLLPQLRRHAAAGHPVAIHFLTSRMGSIADNGSGGSYLYRSAKAGLNAAVRSLALDLAADGIRVQLLHPGWVRTAMGGDAATLPVAESVAGMLERCRELEMPDSGRFIDWAGEVIPW